MILEETGIEEIETEETHSTFPRSFPRRYDGRIPGRGVKFIDRPLKPGEKSNYQCNKCGAYLSHDTMYSHVQRCQPNKL